MTQRPNPQHQDELAMSSIAPHALFPGRTTLYPQEVAKALSMSLWQVLDLIAEYELTGGASGIAAVNIGSGPSAGSFTKGSKSERKYWRIPVSAYDAFVQSRKNNQPTTTTTK